MGLIWRIGMIPDKFYSGSIFNPRSSVDPGQWRRWCRWQVKRLNRALGSGIELRRMSTECRKVIAKKQDLPYSALFPEIPFSESEFELVKNDVIDKVWVIYVIPVLKYKSTYLSWGHNTLPVAFGWFCGDQLVEFALWFIDWCSIVGDVVVIAVDAAVKWYASHHTMTIDRLVSIQKGQ